MSTPENGPDEARRDRTLAELLALWQGWNSHDVTDRAARRADAAGDTEQAEKLRALNQHAPSAMTALAAEHELTSLLTGWRWHTVLAAREQGATWADIADATSTPGTGDAGAARGEFLAQLERARDTKTRFDIPFHDADRYEAAAAPDIAGEAEPVADDHERTTMATGATSSVNDQDRGHAERYAYPGDPGVALEDAWFRTSLEQTVPADTPDRAAVIDGALEIARERFVADGTITRPEQALDLLSQRDPVDAPAPLEWLTAAELLVRAERADNRTYLANSYRELDDALREVEALEGEAWNRAEASGDDGDRALAQYLGLLMNEPDVARFDEFTALHNTVHQALGVPAAPPEDDAAREVTEPEPVEAPVDGPAWAQGPDAAAWSADRGDVAASTGQADDSLMVGTLVLPGGLPPDDDDEDDRDATGRHEDEFSTIDAQITEAYDRGPWSEASSGRQWDSLGAWARDAAAESTAREAATPGRMRVDDGPEIARRLAEVRARVAVRDSALAAEDVPATRAHAEDDAHSEAPLHLDDDAEADGAWDR